MIDCSETGLFSLTIPDADGKPRTYRIALAPPGLAAWAVTLTRADAETTYRVTAGYGGRWACTCESFFYKKRGVHDCKHTLACRGLRAMLRTLTQQSQGVAS